MRVAAAVLGLLIAGAAHADTALFQAKNGGWLRITDDVCELAPVLARVPPDDRQYLKAGDGMAGGSEAGKSLAACWCMTTRWTVYVLWEDGAADELDPRGFVLERRP